MPCSDPRLDERDDRANRAANLLILFSDRGDLTIPEWIRGVSWIWPNGKHCDEVTDLLCSWCRVIDEDFIYNGRDPDCRKLADWWDDHKGIDAQRQETP